VKQRSDYRQEHGGTLIDTSVPTEAKRRIETGAGTTSGKHGELTQKMIPKHDNLTGG
jgi:hypothetical protein